MGRLSSKTTVGQDCKSDLTTDKQLVGRERCFIHPLEMTPSGAILAQVGELRFNSNV